MSFHVPTNLNSDSINKRHYHRYFKHQMHMAPSTDQRMALIAEHQGFDSTISPSKRDKAFLELEQAQELFSVGFYGIADNSENMICLLLMTNCCDIREASSLVKGKSGFNNPQQYVVPDL